ncbi:MAG: glycosyltransferase [Candidatus Methylomirabilales bacterium]
MRIALITPYYYPSMRGNSITVGRIASGLRERGHRVEVYSLEALQDQEEMRSAIRAFDPDLVHGFHAYITGEVVVSEAAGTGVPALVTLTGTDVNHDLFDPQRRQRVVEVVKEVQGVVAFHQSVEKKLLGEVPELHERVRVIRQTVACNGKVDAHRTQWGLDSRNIIFFFPAGIRRVKNLPFCVPPLSRLHARHPHLHALYAGPIVEEEEAKRLLSLLEESGWARYLGELPHKVVCSIMQIVDVMVNSSVSEGGMSNAVLEAMSQGVAVLASDIEGNRSVIVDEVDGLLFTSEDDFERKAERLILDPDLRRRLGSHAMQKIEREFSREKEIDAYERFYGDLLGGGVTGGPGNSRQR